MSEFKGTKGVWCIKHNNDIISDINGILASTFQHNGYPKDEKGNYIECEESIANANLIAEAGNVRQKINCSLTELLDQRDELLKALEVMVDSSYGTHRQFSESVKIAEQIIQKVKGK